MGDKFKKSIVALAVVTAGVFGSAVPAQAAWSDCAAAQICIYNGTGGTGLKYSWSVGYILTLPGDCLVLTGSQNNTTSSVYANTSFVNTRATFYDLAGGGANRGTNVAGFQDANLGAAPGWTGFNNVISSICITTG